MYMYVPLVFTRKLIVHGNTTYKPHLVHDAQVVLSLTNELLCTLMVLSILSLICELQSAGDEFSLSIQVHKYMYM